TWASCARAGRGAGWGHGPALSAIVPPRAPVLRSVPEVTVRLPPRRCAKHASGTSPFHVARLEMDAAVAPRQARLVRRLGERAPGQRDVLAWHEAGFDGGRAGADDHGHAEAVAPGEIL